MTNEQLKNLRDAIDAQLNGKQWQFREINNGEWLTANRVTDIDRIEEFEYRPKLEPVSRPWDFNSRPREVTWVYRKGHITDSMIVAWGDDEVIVATKHGSAGMNYDDLFKNWLQRDGSICGVTE